MAHISQIGHQRDLQLRTTHKHTQIKRLALSGQKSRKEASQQRPHGESHQIHTQGSGRFSKLQQQAKRGASRTTHHLHWAAPQELSKSSAEPEE